MPILGPVIYNDKDFANVTSKTWIKNSDHCVFDNIFVVRANYWNCMDISDKEIIFKEFFKERETTKAKQSVNSPQPTEFLKIVYFSLTSRPFNVSFIVPCPLIFTFLSPTCLITQEALHYLPRHSRMLFSLSLSFYWTYFSSFFRPGASEDIGPLWKTESTKTRMCLKIFVESKLIKTYLFITKN